MIIDSFCRGRIIRSAELRRDLAVQNQKITDRMLRPEDFRDDLTGYCESAENSIRRIERDKRALTGTEHWTAVCFNCSDNHPLLSRLHTWHYVSRKTLTARWVNHSNIRATILDDARFGTSVKYAVHDVNEGLFFTLLPNLHVWTLRHDTVPAYLVHQFSTWKHRQRSVRRARRRRYQYRGDPTWRYNMARLNRL